MAIKGRLDGLKLSLEISSRPARAPRRAQLTEPPALMLSVGRRLASEGLDAGHDAGSGWCSIRRR